MAAVALSPRVLHFALSGSRPVHDPSVAAYRLPSMMHSELMRNNMTSPQTKLNAQSSAQGIFASSTHQPWRGVQKCTSPQVHEHH